MDNLNILKNILNLILKDIKKQVFLVYFRKISILEINNSKVTFGVFSSFMKENIEAKFFDLILNATKETIESIESIEFIVDKNIENPSNKEVIDCPLYFKEFLKKTKKSILTGNDIIKYETPVNNENNNEHNYKIQVIEKYTLNQFVVGPSNQLAFYACEAVIKNPGKSYNPLYIYGEVGLGKTHLLQGTGNAISKKYKDKVVKSITADKFITEYINAVKKKSVDKLRQKYCEADIIIIDDVQFLQKKEQTQNELYNIFNILYDAQKQIIISGDKPPKDLTELEPRLRSRFEWGIIVDISRPDFETRLAIIQEKAREKQFLLPHNIAEYIAANVTDSIRELEGILNQIIAEYELDNSIPSLEKIRNKLHKLNVTKKLEPKENQNINQNNNELKDTKEIELLNEKNNIKNEKNNIKENRTKLVFQNYEDIINSVAKYFGIEKEAILSENRKKELIIPRQIAMYILKTRLNYTYEKIGSIFSGRNHSAVLYSCSQLEKNLKKDQKILYDINLIKKGI